MTLEQAINTLDARQANTFGRPEKIGWLSQVDMLIWKELMLPHGKSGSFSGYTTDTDPGQELLVPQPWEELYLHYMQAQMDYCNGEMTRYANAAAMYNSLLAGFKNHYNRANVPRGQTWRYF
jgi:hypothetical protein